jgi:hypothetical protein
MDAAVLEVTLHWNARMDRDRSVTIASRQRAAGPDEKALPDTGSPYPAGGYDARLNPAF